MPARLEPGKNQCPGVPHSRAGIWGQADRRGPEGCDPELSGRPWGIWERRAVWHMARGEYRGLRREGKEAQIRCK